MRGLSAAAKQAMFAPQTGEAFIVLLTFSHPSLTDDIRVASDNLTDLPVAGGKGVISNGLEYVYCPFAFQLPQEDNTGLASASLTVDNIDRRITQAVRQANSAIDVKIQIILASSPDLVEISLDDFQLRRCSYNALTITGDLTLEYFDQEPFPSKRFTPADFPGMF